VVGASQLGLNLNFKSLPRYCKSTISILVLGEKEHLCTMQRVLQIVSRFYGGVLATNIIDTFTFYHYIRNIKKA